MEAIIDYKVSDFIKIRDAEMIEEYLIVLDLLQPLKSIPNPKYKWYKKVSKTLDIKAVHLMTYGEVDDIKTNFKEATMKSLFKCIEMLTGLKEKYILGFTITQLYGIISFIKEELIQISNWEKNTFFEDDEDEYLIRVKANERMSIYGVLNVLDNLGNQDVLKWKKIQKLPYLTVFAKLKMDRDKNKIQREIVELQRKEQLKK